jgi:hypothetical protein
MAKSRIETDQQYFVKNNLQFANGITSGSTDATGSLVIPYNLQAPARTIIANNIGTQQYYITVTNMNTSGSTLRFYSTGSGFIGIQAVTASWAAWV